MTNSNDTYGTYNKTTTILSQPDKAIQEGTGSTISQNLVSITLNNPVRVVVVPAHAITDSLEVDGGTITYDSAKTVFANTDSAISHFFTSDAQAVFNECCTDLQWALVADDNGDNTKVKYTMSFGTKGPGTSKENDWAGQFNSRKKTLIDNSGWSVISFGTANSTDHLF